MSKIKIEKPTEDKLKKLDVNNWTTWECEESKFDWEYDCDETCYILEGKVKIKSSDETVENQ